MRETAEFPAIQLQSKFLCPCNSRYEFLSQFQFVPHTSGIFHNLSSSRIVFHKCFIFCISHSLSRVLNRTRILFKWHPACQVMRKKERRISMCAEDNIGIVQRNFQLRKCARYLPHIRTNHQYPFRFKGA